MLERIMKFEFSLTKINSSLQDSLNLDDAITRGLPFWTIDPEATLHKKRIADA